MCKVDLFPDSYLSGMYFHDKITGSAHEKNRNGYNINFTYCPILCHFKTGTTLSDMEADIIAFVVCPKLVSSLHVCNEQRSGVKILNILLDNDRFFS